jgi:hypothetical protein
MESLDSQIRRDYCLNEDSLVDIVAEWRFLFRGEDQLPERWLKFTLHAATARALHDAGWSPEAQDTYKVFINGIRSGLARAIDGARLQLTDIPRAQDVLGSADAPSERDRA